EAVIPNRAAADSPTIRFMRLPLLPESPPIKPVSLASTSQSQAFGDGGGRSGPRRQPGLVRLRGLAVFSIGPAGGLDPRISEAPDLRKKSARPSHGTLTITRVPHAIGLFGRSRSGSRRAG